jgi:PGM1 C-terminal domain
VFSYDGAPDGALLERWVRIVLPTRLRFVAAGETWETYRNEFARMGGIVEAFVCGAEVRSPSVQCRIDPSGATQIISTHDQILGGASGQIYLGCTFPAESTCCPGLHDAARRVTRVLASEGVVGRFSIDFVSTRVHNEWHHHAIEINLRKGGTTHPFLTLQLLTDGTYDTDAGLFRTPSGQPCYYVASDNLCDPAYSALTPDVVIAAAHRAGLAFNPDTGSGVVFHLMGTLAEFGKLGAVCIAPTREESHAMLQQTLTMLQAEAMDVTEDHRAALGDGRHEPGLNVERPQEAKASRGLFPLGRDSSSSLGGSA